MVWLITSGESRFCSIDAFYSYKWWCIIFCFIRMPELPVTTKSKKKFQFKFSYVLVFLEIVVAVVLLAIFLSSFSSIAWSVEKYCYEEYHEYNAFYCERSK